MPTPPLDPDESNARPRVEGERELEILASAREVLSEVGYDRLTMDSVASHAKASKATLYRRWTSKANLVIDALLAAKENPEIIDTGSLRGDLLAVNCGPGGLCDEKPVGLLAGILTAITRDPEFADAFRTRFLGPKVELTRIMFERAKERGEIRDDVDIDLLNAALPGIVLHRRFILGDDPTPELITSVIDQIILPAVLPRN